MATNLKTNKMTKEIRKKTTSVEPPDMPIDIDFK